MARRNHGSRAAVFSGKRHCLYCGKKFLPKCNAQFHCDDECKRLRHKKVVFKRKDLRLYCVICGEEIVDQKYSRLYHREGKCKIKALYYRGIRRWLRRVKSDRIKNSLDYALLEQKVKEKLESYKPRKLKFSVGKEERRILIKAIVKRRFFRKHYTKESQLWQKQKKK